MIQIVPLIAIYERPDQEAGTKRQHNGNNKGHIALAKQRGKSADIVCRSSAVIGSRADKLMQRILGSLVEITSKGLSRHVRKSRSPDRECA
jgi:hypothetical protein